MAAVNELLAKSIAHLEAYHGIKLNPDTTVIPPEMLFREWCEKLGREGMKVDGKPFKLDDRPAMAWGYGLIPTTKEEAFRRVLVLMKCAQVGFTVMEMLATIYLGLKFGACIDPRKRKRLKRENFGQFMEKLTRNSLSVDAAAIETEFKRDSRLERLAVHAKIIGHFINEKSIAGERPAVGEKPTFTVLGGRGGSGKSWFKGNVFDEHKAIVLDADEIKGMLPEYRGWNAHQVHEESGDIYDENHGNRAGVGVEHRPRRDREKAKKAVALVRGFKDSGYRVEAHYVHLPRQEAAKRAVGPFMNHDPKENKHPDQAGRFVPPDVVLRNTGNETAFDQVRGHADKSSFRDNNVKRGEAPTQISRGGKDYAAGEGSLKKALSPAIIFIRRVG